LVLFVIFLSQQRSPCLLMLLQTYSLDRKSPAIPNDFIPSPLCVIV